MAKKPRRRWIVLSIVFCLAYFLAASAPIGKETLVLPAWTLDPLAEPSQSLPQAELAETQRLPFRSAGRFGYFTSNGLVMLNLPSQGLIQLSPDHWSLMHLATDKADIMNPLGEKLFSASVPGRPYFDDDKVFIISPDQNTVTAFSQDGQQLWRYDFPAPLTAADAASGRFIAGMLNGMVEVIDSEGKRLFQFAPGGSRLNVIYAVRLSNNAERMVIISGIDPQRFLFLEAAGISYKVVYHEFLASSLRRPVKLILTQDNQVVIFERAEGLGCFDIATRQMRLIPLDGRVDAIEGLGKDKLIFALVSRGQTQTLIGLHTDGELLIDASYRDQATSLLRTEDRLYLSGSRQIMALDIGSH